MKAINYYSLIVTLILALVLILWGRSCKMQPDTVIKNDKREYDSVVQVIATANQVITALHEKNVKDSFAFEKEISLLKKDKAAASKDVAVLKSKVGEISKKYDEVKNDPVLARIYCDSLQDENELLAGALEYQVGVTDSMVFKLETRVGELEGILQKEKEFRNKFLSADVLKDQKYNTLYDNYSKLNKKHNGAWNRWIKPTLGFAAGTAAGFFTAKAIYK